MTTDAKFWDNIAPRYAAQPVKDIPAFDRKKAITRALLRPDSTVLEVGCGTGSLALELSRSAGHIHAIDVSAEMIRIANEKKAKQGVSNVTFAQGTLDGDAPPPGDFDAVWAYSILHLVPDRRATLRRIFELMKPGGVLVSSNVCLGDSWVPYRPLLAVMRWLGKAPSVTVYDRETLANDLRDAGFVEIEERDVGASKLVAFVLARKPPTN
ncbi:MAG: methyltransferase domain-containing protein [Polyangiaceae bacterium]